MCSACARQKRRKLSTGHKVELIYIIGLVLFVMVMA